MSNEREPSARAHAVRLADVNKALTLFAQALATRPLRLAQLDPGSDDASPNAEPTIFLPEIITSFASARDNRRAYRTSVLRQVGYLLEGTFDFDLAIAEQTIGERLVWSRSDPNGASDLERFFAACAAPRLLERVFFAVERLRLDSVLRRRYPGAIADLERLLLHVRSAQPALNELAPELRLLEGVLQYCSGADRQGLVAGDVSPRLDVLLEQTMRVERKHASVYDSARAALRICRQLQEGLRGGSGSEQSREAERDELSGSLAAQMEALAAWADDFLDRVGETLPFGGTPHPTLARARLGAAGVCAAFGLEASSEPQPGAPTEDREASIEQDEAGQQATGKAAPVERSRQYAGADCYFYDEWDYTRRCYLSRWCHVYEAPLRGDDRGFLLQVRRRHALIAREVRRGLRFSRPEVRARLHRRSDGDELDLDALIDGVLDRKTGHARDAQLYIGHKRALRDVSSAFLVDMSASTDFPLPQTMREVVPALQESPIADGQTDDAVYLYGGPVPEWPAPSQPVRRVIDVAQDMLVLMSDALHELGDRHAIYGFSSSGRQKVEFLVVKAFDEVWSARVASAVAAMQPRRATRTGAAIRHAVTKLVREPAQTRVLIIISDGYPEDTDYGPDPKDLDYGLLDTARALQEAEAAGIATFCIAIDPAGHDYLRKMCADACYLVIDDVASLPRELTKIYRALTNR